jgi:hypothetical protein
MIRTFEYDVFLSYSSKDKKTVHDLAERLKKDGLRVWLDAWAIKPGDSIPLKIQHGVEQSRTLLMCMSPAYFDSEWGKVEHLTLLFRDPTNAQRRFIPLLIEDCNPPDIIAQFAHIDWRMRTDDDYAKLLAACREENAEEAKQELRDEAVSAAEKPRIDEALDIINKIEYLYGINYGSPKTICDELHIDPFELGTYLEELSKSGLVDVQKGTNSPKSLPNGINNVKLTGKALLKIIRI